MGRSLALVSLLALCALACGSKDTEPTTSFNVAGTWTGTLTLTAGTETHTGAVTLALTQNGTQVSGTLTMDETEAVTGSLSGTTLTVSGSPMKVPADDCDKYSNSITFTVTNSTTLTATTAGGTACDGNGMGGHEALHVITGASGTLHKG